MKRLRGLIARADGSTLPGIVSFGKTIESVESGGGADAGDYILPGFIDLQVNGCDATDVMSASAAAICALSARLAREGTTAWLATAITSPLKRIETIAATIAQAMAAPAGDGGAILGLHLEGHSSRPRASAPIRHSTSNRAARLWSASPRCPRCEC